jgi:nitrous oxidase accessory protein
VRKFGVLPVLLLLISVVLVSLPKIEVVKAEPKIIVVPDDYSSIQDAIEIAENGDRVLVKSGLYYAQVVINKSLSLIGENKETTIINAGPTTIIWVEADYVTVTGFTIENAMATTQAGIFLLDANYCNISNNILTQNRNGIRIERSNHNIIAGNTFTKNNGGIAIHGFNNTIYGNQIVNSAGIGISQSSNNIISENNLVNGSISLNDANSNFIIENSITTFDGYSITFTASNNNSFFRNNFNSNNQTFDNSEQLTYLNLSVNIWDNGFEGNYWSDYNGTDTDGDGIGDTPYIINEDNQDNYPLMEPFVIPEFPSWIILPLFLTVTFFSIVIRKRIICKILN